MKKIAVLILILSALFILSLFSFVAPKVEVNASSTGKTAITPLPTPMPLSTPVLSDNGTLVMTPAPSSDSHWWDITIWCDQWGDVLPQYMDGEFTAVSNTIQGLAANDLIYYLPLNVAYGKWPWNIVWFQFSVDFRANGNVTWEIWDIVPPDGNDNPQDFNYTSIGIPYAAGHVYDFSLTTSGTNTVTFSILDTTTGASWSKNNWEWTVPSLDMRFYDSFFSPASAVEGYTTNSQLTGVPYFITKVGVGIAATQFISDSDPAAGGGAPSGIATGFISDSPDSPGYYDWYMYDPSVSSAQVTFGQTGVGADFTGTVVTIDRTNYATSDLPLTLSYIYGSTNTVTYASPLVVSGGEQYVWNSTTGLSTLQSGQMAAYASGSVTGNYVTQYKVTFDQTGVGADFTGTVVTIDGTNYAASDLPVTFWWDAESTHTVSYASPLVVGGGKQYGLGVLSYSASLSNLPSGQLTVEGAGKANGGYAPQYQVTFNQTGVGGDFLGPVVTVDGTNYARSDLPVSFWWDVGSMHIFAYASPLDVRVRGEAKHYAWSSTTGLSTLQSDSLIVNGSGSVTGNYATQYEVTFDESGVGVNFLGKVVAIDGTNYNRSSLSVSFWWDVGSMHTFAYASPLVVRALGGSNPYTWSSTTGLSTLQSDSLIVNGSGSVTGNYQTQSVTQYEVTFDFSISDGSSGYQAPSVSYYSIGTLQHVTAGPSATVMVDSGTTYTYDSVLGNSGSSERWQSETTPTGTISSSVTIAPEYYHQYYVTASYLTSDGSTPSADVVLSGSSLGSVSQTTLATSTTQVWLDAGQGWSVNNPINAVSGTERWDATTGTLGTVNSATAVAPSYYHQYLVTLGYSIVNMAGSGFSDPVVDYVESGVGQTVTALQSSGPSVWADAGSNVAYPATLTGSTGTQQWITSTTSYDAAADTLNPTYYHQYTITPYYTVSDGSSPTVNNVVGYEQFGSSLIATPTLGSSGGTAVWVDAGTSMTYTSPISGATGERWQVALADSGTCTAITTVSASGYATVEYYHQFSVVFQYTIQNSPNGSPSNPTATYAKFGTSGTTFTASQVSPGSDWVDAGSNVTYTNPINGATGERWKISPEGSANPYAASSSVAATGILDPTYYHQFLVTLEYNVINSPAGTPTVTNIASYTTFGSLSTATPVAAPTATSQVWADAGSGVTYASPITSGSEQWIVTSSDTGTYTAVSPVTAAATENPGYYHQFQLTAKFSTSDSSAPSGNVVLSGTQFGGALPTMNLGTTAQNVWLDAGTSWSVNSPITASSTEQWIATTGTSGTVGSSTAVSPLYYHQYKVTFEYTIQNTPKGSPSNPTATYTKFGVSGTAFTALQTSPGNDWVDAGSNVTYTNPIAGVSGERWMVSGGATPYVAISSVTASGILNPTYYHQFQVTLQYHFVNSPAGAPTVTSVVSFTGFGVGSTATPVAAPATSSQVWADAGSAVTYTSPITSGSERWMVTSSDGGAYGAVSSVSAATTVNPGYYHQYLETVSYSVSGGGSPKAPTFTANRFGSSAPVTLTGIATGYWFDSGATWSVSPNPLTGSGGSQRWQTSQAVSGTVSSATTLAFMYYHQFQLTMYTNYGTTVPSLGGWFNAGSKVTISATAPTIVTGERYLWYLWMGSGSGSYTGTSNPASSAVTMNGPILEFAFWGHQFQLTIRTNGVPSPYSTNVNLGGVNEGHASDASPYTTWITAGSSTRSIGVDSTVSGGSGVRLVFTSWSDGSLANSHSSITMNAPQTLTANYKTQYKVTFSQSGIGSDFRGTVVKIDGTSYAPNNLPASFWWDKSSTHTFQFLSPLTGSNGHYVWKSTTGLSTLQTATITVSGTGTITGNYVKQ